MLSLCKACIAGWNGSACRGTSGIAQPPHTHRLHAPATAGTPFWKLVLKQFDDLLVKVGAAGASQLGAAGR